MPKPESLYDIPNGCICYGDGLMGMECTATEHARLRARDPRRNPRVGDVLRKNGKNRRIINILPGFCPDVTYMSGRRQGSIFLPNWHKWAKDAEVIHCA